MRKVLVCLLLAGCATGGEPERKHRWPDHRKNHDQALEDILEKRVEILEKELGETRAAVAKMHVATSPPAPAAPAAAPSPAVGP